MAKKTPSPKNNEDEHENPTSFRLTADEIRWLLDDAFHARPIDETISKFSGPWTRRALSEYLKRNKNLKAKYDQCLKDSCEFLENDIINVHKLPHLKAASVPQQSQYANNLMKILAARKPEVYGNKLDLSVTNQISITKSLDAANDRLKQFMRDVTPALAEPNKKTPEKK